MSRQLSTEERAVQKAKVDAAAEKLLDIARRFGQGKADEDAVFLAARKFVKAEESE